MHSLLVVFDCIEQYAPGFRKLIIDKEVLTPPDLERIFGLTGGVWFRLHNNDNYLLQCFSNYMIEYISWSHVTRSTLLSQTNIQSPLLPRATKRSVSMWEW